MTNWKVKRNNIEKFRYELEIKLNKKQKIFEHKLHKFISDKNKCYERNITKKHILHEEKKNLTNVNFNLNELRVLNKGLKHIWIVHIKTLTI